MVATPESSKMCPFSSLLLFFFFILERWVKFKIRLQLDRRRWLLRWFFWLDEEIRHWRPLTLKRCCFDKHLFHTQQWPPFWKPLLYGHPPNPHPFTPCSINYVYAHPSILHSNLRAELIAKPMKAISMMARCPFSFSYRIQKKRRVAVSFKIG